MKCLRCGYCCINLSLVTIHPDYIKEDLIINELPEEAFIFKPDGEKCPHLTFEDNKAVCKIHQYNWYYQTPCYNHNQIERKNSDCRLGKHIIDNNVNVFDFLIQQKRKA